MELVILFPNQRQNLVSRRGVRATARRDQYRISQMTVGNGGAFLAQAESAVLALDGGDTGSDMAADTGFGGAGSDQQLTLGGFAQVVANKWNGSAVPRHAGHLDLMHGEDQTG